MEWVSQVDNLFAFLTVVVVLVVLGRPYLNKKYRNGDNSTGENLLRRLLAEHERDCSNVDEIKREIVQVRADIRTLERNVSEDIRGVHERLDRVIESRH
jgi:Tfp pilus assembly protein PilO